MTTHLILFLCLSGLAHAATVEAVKGGASARTAETLGTGATFATKKSSQSQLRLNKGFVRLGSNSQVQLGKEDQVQLKEGVMMVGSDGAKKRESVKVTAPGYSFNVQGTALIAYSPGSYIKITVLEGRIRVALQSLLGEFVTLEAGQMLVINPADKRLPDPVEVDLNRLVSTSQLTTGALGPPPTDPFIQNSASEQGGETNAGQLARTPFALRGASPEVTVFQLVNDLDDSNAVVNRKPYSLPDQAVLADTEIKRQGARTKTLEVQMRSTTVLPAISGTITVSPDVFGSSPKKLVIDADDTLLVKPGANITTPSNVALSLNGVALDIDGATLRAGNGTESAEALELNAAGLAANSFVDPVVREFDLGVKGSTLQGASLHVQGARGLPGAPAQSIGIDSTTITAPRGITIGADTIPSKITIRNSSQLLALAGSIQMDAGGRAITVAGSTLRADATSGQIVMEGDTVTLNNATMNADVIKARGHSASGDAVIVDGGSFVARTVLKFYATGAAILRFKGNVSITSPLSVFSARTVEVENGGRVSSTGAINVYTDLANFNRAGFGEVISRTSEIPGGTTPVVQPFDTALRPGF